LEKFIDYELEFSIVAARSLDGSFAHYGVIENQHQHHILDLSLAPGRIRPEIAQQAIDITQGVMEALAVVGVLCVEFFLGTNGQLLINELAPRPHNSGHLTLDACLTSQFEQQLRAVCGLPLGSTQMRCGAAVMANLLGDLWTNGEPNWTAVCALEGVKLHLYGKKEPCSGRKMGHLTVLGSTPNEALEKASAARLALASDQ
jgi:5-(carboxyamino)imidazole ribonucleotide synthase